MSDLRRYLRQQRELYGDALFLDQNVMSRRTDSQNAPLPGNDALVAESASTDSTEQWQHAASLAELHELIHDCMKCPLGGTRTKFVFGVGDPDADVVVIGEAPGADEDRQGEPFVGRAGQLLNDILKAVQFKREDVYICNILKCRPPNNRDPLPAEVAHCEPYLHHQLALLRPKIILALGRIAAQTLLRTHDSLTKLRASEHTYQGVPLHVTYHPAALLRNPNWKRPTWEDVQKFRARYDELARKR